MSTFRGLGRMSLSYLLMTLRSKTALFWMLVFPLFLLIGFGYVFGSNDPQRVAYIVPGILTITIISATFFGTSMGMVVQRENGVFRRYRVTPVTPVVVVASHAVLSMLNLTISLILQIITAILVFKITIAGSLTTLALIAFAGFFAFAPLGLIVGSVAKDMKTAPAITNLLFFPMMFLSGAAMPYFLLPSWLQAVGKFIPATYVVESLQGVMVRGETIPELLAPLAVLLVTGIVAFALNGLLFRWESDEPLNLKRLGIVISGLTVVYLIAAFAIPSFKMAERPSARNTTGTNGDVQEVRVLKGMTVLDGLGGRLENARVTIRGQKIAGVEKDSDAPLPEGATVDDLSGSYLVPGLFDSHIHLGGSGGGNASMAEYSPQRQIHDLQVYLALGITSVVSLTDNYRDLGNLRAMVENGEMRSPRMFFAGPSITAPDGHPASMFKFVPGLAEILTRQITTAEQASETINELASYKVDLVKLVLEEGAYSRDVPRLSEEAFRGAVKTAKELGLRTTCHVDSDKNARLAIDAGVDGLQHIPPDLSEETIRLLVEKGITLTPTLAVFEGYKIASAGAEITDSLALKWTDKEVIASLHSSGSWLAEARKNAGFAIGMRQVFEQGLKATRKTIQGGVKIIAGSDAGNPATFHGPGLIRELELLVEAGMPPEEVLLAATSRPADRFGRSDLGRIAEGAYADLVVLAADPAKDVRAFREVKFVYFGGKKLDRETLLTSSPGKWQPGR